MQYWKGLFYGCHNSHVLQCKAGNKQLAGYYTILVLICKIYTLSRGFLLSSRICLKWLGVRPVTFLN